MTSEFQLPNEERVRDACKKFDDDYSIAEEALTELFHTYPANTEPRHILLKVAALNALYSTRIMGVTPLMDVALHICNLKIDSELKMGSPDIVNKIAVVTSSITGKLRNNYSFATKYCSWHNDQAYPVWDSRVDEYFWWLRHKKHLEPFKRQELWTYPTFLKRVTQFREQYNLSAFSFKEIDKFLWLQGEASSAATSPSYAAR